MAAREAVKYIQSTLTHKITEGDEEILVACARTSMNSKLIGHESDLFAKLVVKAVLTIKTITALGDVKYPIKSVNVVKSHGQASIQSEFVNGYVLQL